MKVSLLALRFGVLAASLFITAQSVHAAEEGEPPPLGRNPFMPPMIVNTKPPPQKTDPIDIEKQTTAFHLRATMVSPPASIANINGIMIRKGGTIEGFTVVDIQEQKVVLEKDGQAMTIAFEKKTAGGGK